MIDNPLHVVFTGGGTAGHLFPGLAVAEQLVEEDPHVRITFAGSGSEFERRHVAASGFEYVAIRCKPAPRRLRDAFAFFTDNVAGYREAGRFLDEQDVDVVVGLGGYASAPTAKAAARRGTALILLEQNAVPGKVTRWLAGSATMICAAMGETRAKLRCPCPVRVTGNPVRATDYGDHRVLGDQRQLLVLGGSRGARSINESVPPALQRIRAKLGGWKVVHQSGELDFPATAECYRQFNLSASVVPFIDNVPAMLAATDLAVSRAGGTTLAELTVAGVPAVLLPYPHAADDHQRKNADVLTGRGAAVTLDERELSDALVDRLAGVLGELLEDPDRRARMSAAMHELARPDAAAEVAELIFSVAGRRSLCCGEPVAA
ncbi:MAG TPA: UDP-N-acetylglucosamine--N-acetylmuramyl-(pentapeptide) pyrophosphoryl-undecaprenol N-acetylglucosamine transferase [Thermoguttaceae bacterium]|nr:UDP-N-acetylglucosamine--N-acetylmuramyl-(pentapeptide) pyrophosphoryl-undecaprenol N-acetylglucosamine transferase [Thermoguttaceae bacterium]